MTRVLVCGGRAYNNAKLVYDTLYALEPSLIIQGGATGADFLAREYAGVLAVPLKTYKADWFKHGKAAGPIRNQQMLDFERPEVVVAFKGGDGTADMVARAKKAGIPIMYVGDI
jgi:hypothetical protein